MATALDAHSISVGWSEPPPTQQNGILTHYTVGYQCTPLFAEQDCATRQLIISVNKPGRVLTTITSLYPHTVYSILVSASTALGPGPLSFPVSIATKEGGGSLTHYHDIHLTSYLSFVCFVQEREQL